MFNDLDYKGIEFSVSKRDYCKIEQKNNICINVFCYENYLAYPVYVSDENLENCMDLLLITDANKSHYVHIRYFNRYMFNKTKCKIIKHFCKYYLQCFSSKRVLMKRE